MLEWLKAIGTIACSWPAIVIVALIVFRKPLLDLIKQLTGSNVRNFTIGLGPDGLKIARELSEVAEGGKQALVSMGQLHTEVEREMDELAKKGQRAVDNLGQLHTNTERQIGELAMKSQHAMENMLRLSEQMAESQPVSGISKFIHIANAHNTTRNWTIIDNPLTNNKPDAFLIVTQYWRTDNGEVYNPQPIGVWFTREGKWSVFNQNKDVPMPIGAAFNVLVL